MVHSSQEETKSRRPLFDLTFNFALSARLLGRVGGPPGPSDQSLPFGFASRENFPNGFLETKTKFAFRNGKLIVDSRPTTYRIYPSSVCIVALAGWIPIVSSRSLP